MADLKLSPSYFVDVIRNDHFEQVTKKKCQSWNGREIVGWETVGKVCMANLRLSPSYFVDVIRNDHFEQVTKKKCQSWNGREIVG